MTKDTKKPFFMYWAINILHYPYQGESKWIEHYKDPSETTNLAGKHPRVVKRLHKKYLDWKDYVGEKP